MNKNTNYEITNETCGFISQHNIHNGNLILLIDVHLDGYNERVLMEKSFFIGSKEFYKLVANLKISNIKKYDDFNKLDGVGIFAEIIRLEDGTHAIGKVTLDEEYWEYCRAEKMMKEFRQYMKQMEGTANE